MAQEPEIISPEQARQILDQAIRERIGEYWYEQQEDSWALVTHNDYMARLTKDRTNLDFYVDLLGEVRIEEKEITMGQESGRIIAWLLLMLSVVIALLIARIAGFL
jgi:hypothetical protein